MIPFHLDQWAGNLINGLGLQPALEHPRSPGGQADLNSELHMALDSLLKASSTDTKYGAGNSR